MSTTLARPKPTLRERNQLRYASRPGDPSVIAAGFIGDTRGMTDPQLEELEKFLKQVKPPVLFLHHRMRPGADVQANIIARKLEIMTVGHPLVGHGRQASDLALDYRQQERFDPARTRDMLKLVKYVICAPFARYESRKDQTWRIARECFNQGKPVVLIFPDGDTNQ